MTGRPNYVVYAPSFSPDSGGGIFLHELVNALNRMGENAVLWPMKTPSRKSLAEKLRALWQRPSLLWKKRRYAVNADLDTPVARSGDLRPDSIVVYPEVTLGNPLNARNVVRWLLYKPGLRDPYSFGNKEMFFRAGEMSDLPELTGGAPDLFLWKINPVYRDEGRPDRKGACFIVRKGSDKPRISETADAIQIEDLSHEEIARIFNDCEVFYSYDEATFYSQYAAVCGCLSVVIPGLYRSREEWVRNHELGRYGIAYGLDDLDHARATQSRVIELLREQEALGLKTVDRFVALTQKRFGAPA